MGGSASKPGETADANAANEVIKANMARLQKQSTKNMMALHDAELEVAREKKKNQEQLMAAAAGCAAALVIGAMAARRMQSASNQRASKELAELQQRVRGLEAELARKAPTSS